MYNSKAGKNTDKESCNMLNLENFTSKANIRLQFNSIQPAHVFMSFERMLVIEFLQSLLTDCDILIFATCAS